MYLPLAKILRSCTRIGKIDARRQWATFVGILGRKNVVKNAGYGHAALAPVQIVVKDMNVRLIRDEEYPASTAKK
jgi:hypothetical protein